MKNTKLITQALKARFAQVGEQRDEKDPLIIAKFFSPIGSATWYAIAYYPEENICFGYVTGLGEDEYGYFSIAELEEVRIKPFGLSIERDQWFEECRMSAVLKKAP